MDREEWSLILEERENETERGGNNVKEERKR